MDYEPREQEPSGWGRRLLLLFLFPVWVPLFLLRGAVRICGDGLVQQWEELIGRQVSPPTALHWLLGLPGLALFPALVGLRGLALLLRGLGRFVLRAGPTRSVTNWITIPVGILALAVFPVWLGPLVLIWLFRWVLWRLLVPEFERATSRAGPRRDSRFVTFIGLRYLFGRRETALHSATAFYAAAGIALGVCALVVVLAVMSGFDGEVKSRIVGTNAHVILLRFGQQGLSDVDSLTAMVNSHPQTEASAPMVYGKAMLSAGDAAEGVFVEGIDWDRAVAVTSIEDFVRPKPGVPRLAREGGLLPGIILGKYVAENLGVFLGDEVLLVSPAESRRTPLGFVPRMRRFVCTALFDSGMYEFDASMAFVDLEEARTFFGLEEGRVTGIEIRLKDMDQAPQVADEIVASLGGFPYRANNWIDLNRNLFEWMQTEKRAMFVILTMIILVAGFNIASSLIMVVMEKRREIGILKSMGATSMAILRIFVLEGWVMAFSGTAIGAGIGLLLCHLLERYRFIRLPEDVYFIDTLPVKVQASDVGLVVASVLAIAALSTLYPAWKASQLDPIEAIQSE